MRLIGLKGIRKASGRTQIQAARELSIPIDTYRGWEQLKSSPRATEINMLADFFGCSSDSLYGRTTPQQGTDDRNEFTDQNKKIVFEAYDAMNDEGRAELVRHLEILLQVPKYTEEESD